MIVKFEKSLENLDKYLVFPNANLIKYCQIYFYAKYKRNMEIVKWCTIKLFYYIISKIVTQNRSHAFLNLYIDFTPRYSIIAVSWQNVFSVDLNNKWDPSPENARSTHTSLCWRTIVVLHQRPRIWDPGPFAWNTMHRIVATSQQNGAWARIFERLTSL